MRLLTPDDIKRTASQAGRHAEERMFLAGRHENERRELAAKQQEEARALAAEMERPPASAVPTEIHP